MDVYKFRRSKILTWPSLPPVANVLVSLVKLIAFTCPSCAINCYIICMLCRSHTEQIPFICVVANMLGLSQFQSKLVTGAECSALTDCFTSHSNFPYWFATSQILTNSPDVARKSFLADEIGAHIILEGGYSCGKSNSLMRRWVVYGC